MILIAVRVTAGGSPSLLLVGSHSSGLSSLRDTAVHCRTFDPLRDLQTCSPKPAGIL